MNETTTTAAGTHPRLAEYTDDTTPPYKCRECGRTFDKAQGIAVHFVRKHTGRNWDTRPNLPKWKVGKRGRKVREKSGGGTCPVCRADFSSRQTMTTHLRNIHGKSIKDFEPDKFGCPYCDFESKTRTGLTNHIKNQHSNETGLVNIHSANNGSAKAAAQSEPATITTPTEAPHFCPACGEDIQSWKKQNNE